MDYFPLFARLNEIRCLVVGGGDIAYRKTRLLIRARAKVTVVAPEINDELRELAESGTIELIVESFTAKLISQYQLIIAATASKSVNKEIADTSMAAHRFCNVVDDRKLSSVIVPAIVDRSPVIIAISTGGTSPVLATRLRQQIEQLIPQGISDVAKFSEQWRPVVQERYPEPDARRRFWQDMLGGELTDRILEGDIDTAETLITTALGHDEVPETGYVWIVGAGPGDPELLTLKAIRILGSAEAIVHDRLVTKEVLDFARKDAEFISVGKQAGQPSISQPEINDILIRLARDGKRVCRLKGGDPFIFGRGGEEIKALDEAGIGWQVIPGITAAAGCAAAAGIPLTHRNTSRALVMTTAHTADDHEPDWETLGRTDQTVVFYMAVSKIAQICAQLRAVGRDKQCPAALIENGTTNKQRMIQGTLETLPDRVESATVNSPALLIVGEVVALMKPVQKMPGPLDSGNIWSQAARDYSLEDGAK